MIDYIKLQLFVEQEDLLTTLKRAGYKVTGQHDLATGHILDYPITAINGNLKVEIKSAQFIQLSGSIHKFAHSNVNYTDFFYSDLIDTILSLIHVLKINPQTTLIHNIEFGVNINPPFVTKQFLKQVLNYSGRKFSPMKSYDGKSLGIECQFAQFRIKLYCKKTQYYLPDETMRFEIHVGKMNYLLEKNIAVKYLSDIFNIDAITKMSLLLNQVFDDIVIIDKSIDLSKLNTSEHNVYQTWSHPIQLQDLYEKNRKKFQRQRRQFRDIQNKYATENKQKIASILIADKIKKLLMVAEYTSTILTNFKSFYSIGNFDQSYQRPKLFKHNGFNHSYHSDKGADSSFTTSPLLNVSPSLNKQLKLALTFHKTRKSRRKKNKTLKTPKRKKSRRRNKIGKQTAIPFPYESTTTR